MQSIPNDQPQPSKFEQLVKLYELKPNVATQLKEVLSTCDIALVCDDSGSMASKVVEPGQDPFAPNPVTRWAELKKLAAEIIKFVTAINETQGLDLYFLNRGTIKNVPDISGLQQVFLILLQEKTPLLATLRKVYADKKDTIVNDRKLLIIVATTVNHQIVINTMKVTQSFIIYLPQSREVETFILALQSALIEKRIWNILTGGMVKSKISIIPMILEKNK